MELKDFIKVKVSNDRLEASLEANVDYLESLQAELDHQEDDQDGHADHPTDELEVEAVQLTDKSFKIEELVTAEAIRKLLTQENIQYGLDDMAIQSFCEVIVNGEYDEENTYTQVVATGDAPINGEDGSIDYHISLMTQTKVDEAAHKVDFKEMMKIPVVEIDDPLITIIKPTEGESGQDVYGELIAPKPGKDVQIKAGENTKINDKQLTIYATNSGQVHFTEKEIQVLPVYQVSSDLDLNVGNIDFNGSIVIKGDVPEGFALKARGDITIQGIVEASKIEAGGSVFIKEGISALGKGFVKATLDIFAGNVNQANLEAGRKIQVNNSILHSHVTSREQVICQKGHIIGGSVSSGNYIEARDVGNRMSTKTQLYLSENKKAVEKKSYIESRMKELVDQLKKLRTIGDKFEQIKAVRDLTSKERVTLLRQQHSYEKARLELNELNDEYKVYAKSQPEEESNQLIKVVIHDTIYPNVEINVGKYAKVINKEASKVSVIFQDLDFSINPLV
ncbi:DUF342 domain-containing protein [Alkalibacillus salilacus]|uniref:Uncharacterized protein (DUF342 family) n=1 Tax=Alkalibacillus salilacus TaxID=284582 RepID=A0ABT9VDM7_9BACI|nr:FapA family protein [Alkalibacillus salilacus]MDQ0159067.1 uncharacterized protein (DUF342 family) [Alkalibacillus salilacus]